MRTVALTDALTGITDIFDNPPWHLESLLAHKHWCIVRLISTDGIRLMIPIKARRVTLDERFALWLPLDSALILGGVESFGQGRTEGAETTAPITLGSDGEPRAYPVRLPRLDTSDES